MSVLKSKQSGEVTLLNLSVTASVSSYVAANSVLLFTFRGGDGTDTRRSFVRGEKTNSTTLTFYRGNSGGASCTIQWELLEYDSNTDVQDIYESGTGTQNTTITSVDTNASFVVPSGVTQPTDTSIQDTTTAALEITSATNVQRRTGSNGSSSTFAYQVVEQLGEHGVVGVQYFSRAVETGTSFNQTITSVNTARTMVFGSGECNASSYDYADPFRLRLTSSTNVQGNRAGNASWNPSFYVVEFDDNVKVQAGTQTFSSTIEEDVSIASVKVPNAAAQCTASHCMGFALGTHSFTSEANGTNANVKALVETSTNLQLQRDGNFQNLAVDWQVVEADPDAVSVIEVNDTPSTATGTDGVSYSHTIGGNDNRILIVCVTTRGNTNGDTAVSCSFDGVAMTQAASAVSGTSFNVRSTIFYMLESNLPAAGTYTVAITTPSGTSQSTESCAYSVRNAAQQAPEASFTGGADAGVTSIDNDITTQSEGAFLVDCFAGDGNISDNTARTGQTSRAEIPNSTTLLSSTRPVGAAEDWPMAWDFGSQYNRWAHSIVALKATAQGTIEQCEGQADGVSTLGVSLNVNTDVDGDSDGVATVGGTLDVAIDLQGQADGVTSINAVLSAPVALVGQADGTATISAELPVQTMLESQSDGTAIVTGNITQFIDFEGQSDGASTVVDADLPVLIGLESQVDGVANVEGTLDIGFAGESNGFSIVTGQLQALTELLSQSDGDTIIDATLNLDHTFGGQSDGVATVEGSLSILSEIIALESQSDGLSDVVSNLEVDIQLLSGIPGQTTVTASLAPIRVLTTTSDGAATVAGSLDVLTDVASQANGATTVAGSLGVLTNLVAASDGQTGVTGSLYGAIASFHSSAAGQADVSGSLTVATSLASAVSGVATCQGSLAVQTALAGLTEGLADVAATLQKTRPVAGQADGAATVAGTLAVLTAVDATIAAAASVTGAANVQTTLRAAVDGVATIAAQLDQDVPIAGTSDGTTLVAAVLDVLTALEAAANGAADVEATLGKTVPFEGQIDGVSSVGADMLNFVTPIGQADGVATVVSALDVRTALEAVIAGESAPTAALEIAVALIGESLGITTPAGTLAIDGLGFGTASARGRARVNGDLTVIHFASSHSAKNDPRIITRTL